jgi:hypothetical protein
MGYFEKSKEIYKNMKFVSRGRNWVDKKLDMYSVNNGNKIDYSAGTIWNCVDFTIDGEYYNLSLLLEDSNGEQITFSENNVLKGNYFMFTKHDADNYKLKFGEKIWNNILSGKVAIGYTKEMCELSWGEPKKINETITAGGKSEQWVYKDNYLYFNNGKLTSMQ